MELDAREVKARAYVPLGLASRLHGDGEREARFEGAVLVADIAGYAALADRCARQGEDGIERLSQLLGDAFRGALELVEAFGGEVVYLAGDALICYWPAAGDDHALQAARALACARRLLAGGAPPAPGVEAPPPLHIGLGTGELWAGRVGGWSGRWNLLFGGPATRAAFAAARRAGPGEIWATRGTRRLLDGAGQPDGWSGDLVPVEDLAVPVPPASGRAQPGSAAGLSPLELLPPFVEERALADDGSWSPELREVDCLFVRLPQLDETAAGAVGHFRDVLFLAHELLGTPSATGRLVIDDRGLTLVWVAGEPMSGRGRTAESSLCMAAQLTARLRAAGIRHGAGLATGRALCALVGTDRRREAVVVGTPMILAARLMDHAEDELLAAGAAPSGSVRLVPVPAPPLKGLSCAASICRAELIDTPAAPDRAADVPVGREGEMAALERHLGRVTGGRGALVAIRGEAGAGKSLVLRSLLTRAEDRGLPCTVAEAWAAERRVAYFVWRRIFRALFPQVPVDRPEEMRHCLLALLARAGRAHEEAPLLNVVFPAGFAENERTRALAGEHRARATSRLLVSLLEQAITGPRVIGLEDLHNMDSASVQLLDLAVRRLPSALFVVTTRPARPDDAAAPLLAAAHEIVDLGSLTGTHVARLAEARLGLALAGEVAADICRRAQGLPIYALAYLEHLHDTLTPAERAAPVTVLPRGLAELVAAPDPVKGVLARSLVGLSVLENRALKAASVIGERFGAALLAEILTGSGERPELGGALERLAQRGILRPKPGAPDAFSFAHALVQVTCYQAIPVNHRRTLHQRIAAAIERRQPDLQAAPDEAVMALAHHHGLGGDHARTAKVAELAAERASRLGAFREAMRLLDQCLDAATHLSVPPGPGDPRVRWRRLKAEAAGAIGDRDARRGEAEQAIRLAGARLPRGRLLRALTATAGVVASALARQPVVVAARREPAAAVDRELARAHRQLAIDAYFRGDPVRVAFHTTRALRHAQRVGRSPELAESLASMGTCLGLIGLPTAGRRHLEVASALAEDLSFDASLVYAHVTSALFLIGRGAWAEAQRHADGCQAASERLGDTGGWGNAQALRFWLHHYQGDLAGAAASAERLWDAAKASGNPQHQSWAARFRALCELRRGQRQAARGSLQIARELFAAAASDARRDVRPTYELAPVLADLGATLFALGERAAGAGLCLDALTQLRSARRPAGHAVLEGISSLAEVALTPEPPAGVTPAEVVQVLERYARVFPIGRPRLALWRGRLLARRRRRPAEALWRRGLAEAEALGMRHDAALLREALGDAGP